jgi:hypothetical protein
MKLRIALIWASCWPWASENFSSIPRLAASDLMDSVSAVRHGLSAPIWEKPTTRRPLPPSAALPPGADGLQAGTTAAALSSMRKFSRFIDLQDVMGVEDFRRNGTDPSLQNRDRRSRKYHPGQLIWTLSWQTRWAPEGFSFRHCGWRAVSEEE